MANNNKTNSHKINILRSKVSILRSIVGSLGSSIYFVLWLGLELELAPADLPDKKMVSLDLGLAPLHRTMFSSS